MRNLAWLGSILLVLPTTACGAIFNFGGDDEANASSGGDGDGDDGWNDEGGGDPCDSDGLCACVDDEQTRSDLLGIYLDTEGSVHELITCGGLQIRLAASMRLAILAANDDLLTDESKAQLRPALEALGAFTYEEFEHEADGRWTMSMSQSPDSKFVIRFRDPTNGQVVTQDCFDLDAYLANVNVESSVDLQTMVLDPTRKASFGFSYDGPGPLGHLMNDGDPLPKDFVLHLSLLDIIAGSPGSFGPFESVFEMGMESEIYVSEHRGGTHIEYEVGALESSVAEIAGTSRLELDVRSIMGDAAGLALLGDASGLRYVNGGLAGEIHYSVDGVAGTLAVTSDFGEGQSYPDAYWECAE